MRAACWWWAPARWRGVLPEAYRAVRPIEQVTVWARRRTRPQALAEAWRAEGFDAGPTTDLAAAVAQADIVSCATLATEPLVQGRWLAPGSHLDLIGSFTPQMREADDDCFAGAGLFVDTDEALQKSGDLLGPLARGVHRRGAAARHAGRAVQRQRPRSADGAGAHGLQVGGHGAGGPGRRDAGGVAVQPMVIRLALPPAAAVLTLSARSTSSRSSGMSW